MLTIEKIIEISKLPTASWAIWNLGGENDLEFFTEHIDKLHARAVVLGLNRSDGAHEQGNIPFINFHTPKHRGDKRLERFIQGDTLGSILGCYMTDLSLEIKTDSNLVTIGIDALNKLVKQLDFSVEVNRTVICIGDKTFDSLCKALNKKCSKIIKEVNNSNIRRTSAQVGTENWNIYRFGRTSVAVVPRRYPDQRKERHWCEAILAHSEGLKNFDFMVITFNLS